MDVQRVPRLLSACLLVSWVPQPGMPVDTSIVSAYDRHHT